MEAQHNSERRIFSLDALKAFAILLVCWGHCIQFFCHDGSYWNNSVWEVIYSAHMPLFFFISGYFVKSSAEKLPFLRFARKKFAELIVPYISWHALESVFLLIEKRFSLNVGGGG